MKRLANLDAHGRLVCRGVVVSRHGLRYRVQRVRLGHWYGVQLNPWGVELPSQIGRDACRCVVVVGSAQ